MTNEKEEPKTCPLYICDGSGEVADYQFDHDVKEYVLVGKKACLCQKVVAEEE